ncbi:MAG: tail fiber domain-containing protein [Acidobacteria bacterium]|nr:tail fiber domain-containing protein [Acidobacteriota bacterium]MBI3421362.1 tail fiber domain-containing protein [Acidobacteriota bacterium]
MNATLRQSLLRLAVLLACLTGSLAAQTTSFTYQGRLTDGGASANGPYDLQFKLYDAAVNGNQIGTMVTRDDVNVTNGVFSTTLDFGAAAFPGAARWLEISVRQGASTGTYMTLTPRQPINSTPYAIRALNATTAETVTGPIPAAQITGTLPPGSLPGGGSYINNATTQQAASNFNIDGNGTAGGTLSGNVVNTATQYNLGGQRVLSADSQRGNVFAGLSAGAANTTGFSNSFFGVNAGAANTTGRQNSFFGVNAGAANTGGRFNAFFGDRAGANNSGGGSNAFFGSAAGYSNMTGSANAFFGESAGSGNSTGEQNTFFGFRSGSSNQTGQGNAYFGAEAGLNGNGFANSFFGAGAGASVGATSLNSFFGRRAGIITTGSNNAFFGAETGSANTSGAANAFFGAYAGAVNTTGIRNTFIGFSAAPQHATGDFNTFVGYASGLTQTSGSNNTLLGASTNFGANGLSYATALGAGAVVSASDTIMLGRPTGNVIAPGILTLPGVVYLTGVNGGATDQLCYHFSSKRIGACSSSLRYKSNVESLTSGLNVVQRLRPVTFDWKEGGAHDLGFIAEEVAAVEPLLTYRNDKGEVEGVKYAQISAVLVNAVKEQQAQIEQLKRIVCADPRFGADAALCKSNQQ